MTNEEKIKVIGVLSASIDSLNRAGKTQEVDVLALKIVSLTKSLK